MAINRTNILLIMTDQQRWDSLGCYGRDCIETPNLDRLASEGARYDNCYVNNPVCTPSRASLLTGKPLPGHGIYQLHDILPEDQYLFPCYLREKGYHTALHGKLHVSGRSFEREERHKHDGFETYKYAMVPHQTDGTYNSYGDWLKENRPEFFTLLGEKGRNVGNIPEDCHFTYWAAEETVHFLEAADKETPFFCMMSVVDPHDPYSDFPPGTEELVNREKLKPPFYTENETHNNKPEDIVRSHEHSYLGNYHDYSQDQIMQMRLGYFASIAFLDKQVGRVLDALDEAGLRENTLVIFTSDHGDMLGDHELFAKGPFFYEPSVRVPLIMRKPGEIQPGTVVTDLVQLNDVAATIMKTAGFGEEEVKEKMPDSFDLLSRLRGEETYRESAVCLFRNTSISDNKLHFEPPIHCTMFRKGEYKINVYHREQNGPGGELFHIGEDPRETNNLWGNAEYGEIKAQLLMELMDRMVQWDVTYNGGRGGAMFPPKSQWSKNNPL